MKRLLLSATIATLVLAASSVWAMTTDDIIELCKAGFSPERIAKIVDATGLDEPLTASDWARLKNEGCDEKLVDALLEVLVPVDSESQGQPAEQAEEGEFDQPDVNVYVRGGWNWDGWDAGLGFGWYDPYWSIGWNTWDPYWYGVGWGYPGYWYTNNWWGYPYRHRFGCGPFYYHSHWYNGGYYSSGGYARHKAPRRGSMRDSYYATYKTPQTVQRHLMAKTVATSSLSASGFSSHYAGLASKGAVQRSGLGTTARTSAGRTYTTRSKAGTATALSTRRYRSKGSGEVTPQGTSTGSGRYGTVKTKGTSRTGTATGTRSGTNQRARSKATAPAGSSGTPPPASGDGGRGSTSKGSGSRGGSGDGGSTPRHKG
jgi:hypothetical protein